jgi:hypothetical protein
MVRKPTAIRTPPATRIQGALMAVHHDHGHTPAAWAGVIISFIGFCAGGVFMVAAQPVAFWVSMGVILLGPLVGGILKIMGLGKKEDPDVRSARDHAAETDAAATETPAGVNAGANV